MQGVRHSILVCLENYIIGKYIILIDIKKWVNHNLKTISRNNSKTRAIWNHVFSGHRSDDALKAPEIISLRTSLSETKFMKEARRVCTSELTVVADDWSDASSIMINGVVLYASFLL